MHVIFLSADTLYFLQLESIICCLTCLLPTTRASQVVLLAKNPPANVGDARDMGLIPGSGISPGIGNGNPKVYLPGKSLGQRSLAGYRPWGCKNLDMTEHTHTHTLSLSVPL